MPAPDPHQPVVTLSAPLVDRVEPLLDAAEAADGARAVDEHGELALRDADARDGSSPGWTFLGVEDGDAPVAVATVEDAAGAPLVAAGAVHPDHRRRGHGTALADAVLTRARGRELRAWAHGDHPGAAALATRHGARRERELLQMRRTLTAPLPPATLPDDVRLRAFRPGSDDDAWLAVNARAFAHHAEQGGWTRADLDARTGEPWFDPDGFLLAVDATSGELLGSHWTKVHAATADGPAVGEVYVVGVDPRAQGRRLGTALVLAGLHHLRDRGLDDVLLYVESDAAAALRLYRGLGFDVARVDVQYVVPAAPAED